MVWLPVLRSREGQEVRALQLLTSGRWGPTHLEGFLLASWEVAEEGPKPCPSSWTTDFEATFEGTSGKS